MHCGRRGLGWVLWRALAGVVLSPPPPHAHRSTSHQSSTARFSLRRTVHSPNVSSFKPPVSTPVARRHETKQHGTEMVLLQCMKGKSITLTPNLFSQYARANEPIATKNTLNLNRSLLSSHFQHITTSFSHVTFQEPAQTSIVQKNEQFILTIHLSSPTKE